MIINATSHTMKNIWKFFLFMFLFITFLFVILTNGIRIDSLNFANVKIKQLYIKLDKKLIVTTHTLEINTENKNDTSLSELQFITNKAPLLHSFFKTISIQHLIFNNETIHFLYKDEIFYIDSDFLVLDAKITPFKNSIELAISQIYLKDYEMELKGVLKINTKNTVFSFRGNFNTFNINGGVELNIENNILYYRLNTKKFTTLKPFMDFISNKIDLEPIIGMWIYKKIIANEYTLHNLEGKFNLKTLDYYPLLMKGRASGKNAVVKFDEKAPTALVKDLDVILKNDQLTFDIKEAEYQGKDLTKTQVYIYNLMRKGAGIVVDLKANTQLDEPVHKALRAFNIIVPITQTAGKTEANVILDIGFLPFEVKSYTGNFKIKDANLTLAGLQIQSKSGNIKLDNGMVYIDNANLKYKNLFDLYTSGEFDILKGIYKSQNHIKSLHVNLGENELLDIKDINTSATLNMNNDVSINIDKLNTQLSFNDINNTIKIDNLSSIYNYSTIMKDIKLEDGQLLINTADFNHYEILANLKGMQLPLQKDGKDIKDLDLLITVDGIDFQANTLDQDIQISKKNDDIQININYMDATFDSSKMDSTLNLGKITVKGVYSNIIDTNSSLIIPSNFFIYKVDGSTMTLNNKIFAQNMSLKQTNETLNLNAKNLTAFYVNSLLGKKAFENGSFKLDINGSNSKKLSGTITAQNTTILGLSFYNNLMAFLNTIPSLITLKSPGFNEEGYYVDKAVLDFSRDNDIITINKLKIDGKSADLTGTGTFNLTTGKLDITLEISVLKSLSSVVNTIPVLNYIILGKDGKLHTNVDIKGTIDQPEITTNVISNTAASPLGIIKRTIETPFRPFQ